MTAVSFRCTACGKCCNSPPLMSLPELFRHQSLFVGCLAIRRMPGDRAGHGFSIATQAFDYASLNRCPALDGDNRCSIHDRGKPSVCAVVPLDAALPDHLQPAVLLSRNNSESYIGANCIVAGESRHHDVIVREGRIVDAGCSHALARRREAIRLDRHYWGDAISNQLRSEFRAAPAVVAGIPAAGYLTLSIVPVLQLVARVSDRCRSRCLGYIDSQTVLIERMLAQALRRKRSQDAATTQELHSFMSAHLQLRKHLQQQAGTKPDDFRDGAWVSGFESYLC